MVPKPSPVVSELAGVGADPAEGAATEGVGSPMPNAGGAADEVAVGFEAIFNGVPSENAKF